MPTFVQTWTYNFADPTTEPPTGSQIRVDAGAPYDAVTKVWVRTLTNDGRDVSLMLAAILVGTVVLVQDRNESNRYVAFRVTGAAIAKTDYVEIPVTRYDATPDPLRNSQAVDVYATVRIGPVAPVPGPPSGGGGGVWINWASYQQWRQTLDPHAPSFLIDPPTEEPLTLEQAKLRAGFTWVSPDPRDELMTGFVAAARAKVEQDTALSMLTQGRAVYVDFPVPPVLTLPALSLPLQFVKSIDYTDTAGNYRTLDEASYIVDRANGRIALAPGASWPTDVGAFQPLIVNLQTGWPDAVTLARYQPMLVQAVGLLTAHYATLGRDLASINATTEIPHGYSDVLASYLPIAVI